MMRWPLQWRARLEGLFRWSPLLTLPLVVLVAVWLAKTYSRFEAFGIRYDSRPFKATLRAIGDSELSRLRSQIAVALRPASPSPELSTIDLFLNEADEARLNERLPHSGREFVRAHLLYPDGKSYRVKVRYRGDYVQHWGYFKKSLRINTRKARLFDGMRKLNVIAPKFDETLNNHLAYVLARELGVMAPHSEMVNLRVNGGYRGVHVLVEQLEELTLRSQHRMPGDLYRGEIVGRDRYYGVRNRLIESVAFWDKMAVNNHYAEGSFAPLESFLMLVRHSLDGHGSDVSWEHVDIDAWGRFFALEILLQTFHFSDVHNWRLYYDPWRNQMAPVVWDPDGWHPQWRRTAGELHEDVVSSDLHAALLNNYAVLLARHRALAAFFEQGRDKRFLAEVDRVAAATQISLAADPNVTWNFQHITPDRARAGVERLRGTIRSTLGQVRDTYLGDRGAVSWQVADDGDEVRFAIEGRRPVEAIEFRIVPPLTDPPRVHTAARVGTGRASVDVTGAVALHGDILRLEAPLLARHVVHHTGSSRPSFARSIDLQPGYAAVRFDPPLSGDLVEVRVDRGDRLEEARRTRIISDEPYPKGTLLPGPRPQSRPERWSGEVPLDGLRVIAEDVFIAPGTTLRLASGASLILQGRLIAEGTAEQPIRFLPARGAADPWGTVALRGRGADGSRIRHCHFQGGSGHKDDLAEYSGMLSLHDVHDVIIEDSVLRDSQVVDDMVHAVYSDVTFRRSTFEGAAFDAIDLDMSTALVERCVFTRSGNDALDLMDTQAVVSDTLLATSGDKGASVGEGSRLWVFNAVFEGNQIGLEAKDGATAVLANVTMNDNRQALHAYRKNWRYGTGGTIWLLHSLLWGHEAPIDMKARSQLVVCDSSVDEPVAGVKRVDLVTTPDCDIHALAGDAASAPTGRSGADLPSRYWSRVDATRRGADSLAR